MGTLPFKLPFLVQCLPSSCPGHLDGACSLVNLLSRPSRYCGCYHQQPWPRGCSSVRPGAEVPAAWARLSLTANLWGSH